MLELRDGLFDKVFIDSLHDMCSFKPYSRTELDNPDDSLDNLTATYNLSENESNYLKDNLIPHLGIDPSFTLIRAYINSLRFGDTPKFHTDGGDNTLTVLYYANRSWNMALGGETLIETPDYVDTGVYTAIAPNPGRVLIFSGNLKHTARPPLYQNITRYTIALKLEQLSY